MTEHTHVLTHGEHYRAKSDDNFNPLPPEIIKTGQAFTPTPEELAAFPDKIAKLGAQITVPAPTPTVEVEAKAFSEEEEALADAISAMKPKEIWEAVESGELNDQMVLEIEKKMKNRKGLIRRLEDRLKKQ